MTNEIKRMDERWADDFGFGRMYIKALSETQYQEAIRMTYLEKLTKLNKFAAANPAQWQSLWAAMNQAHSKVYSLAVIAKQCLGTDAMAIEPHTLTAEELEAEESLNSLLTADGGKASDRQFYKVLTWLETIDVGDDILAKL